jgi:DNA invertase Pin-like site-specific DNA recombinase
MLNMMGAFVEFERSLILEREREGIAIAKAAGAYKGSKPKFGPEKIAEIRPGARRPASGPGLLQHTGRYVVAIIAA